MAKNQDSLFRQWQLLRQVPRYPQKITAQAIRDSLSNQGFAVTERTVQRDLNELSSIFPLTVDDREKPYGWSWQKNVKSLDLPALTIDEALTWVLAAQHLANLLPSSALGHLHPYFQAAEERLNREPQPHRGRSWLNKVRTVSATQPLIAPAIALAVQQTVTEALLQEKQIDLLYRRKGEHEARPYQAHPLALIQRGPVRYLYCRLFDYPDAHPLALHRIESIRILDNQTAKAPDHFNIDDELAKGRLGFGAGASVKIQLRFYEGKGEHFYETPLSEDQRLETEADRGGTLLVNATVADTPQLRWWLLGFGDGVEVLSPVSLRHELSATAARMMQRYNPAIETNP